MFKRNGIAACAVLAIASLTYALPQETQPDNQGAAASSPERAGHRRHAKYDPAKRVQRLSKKLNLSSEQQSKVQSVLEDQQKQMQALRQDKSLSSQDRRAKLADLRQNTSAQIRSVLNADQQKKFDQMEQKRQQKMAKRRAKKESSESSMESQPAK